MDPQETPVTPERPAAVDQHHRTIIGVVGGATVSLFTGAAIALAASPSASPPVDPAVVTSAAPSTSTGAVATAAAGATSAPGASTSPGWDDCGRGDHGGGGPGGMHFGQITITAIAGSEVSLATEDGWTRTVTVDDATTYSKDGAALTLADLAAGDTVRLGESSNGDGTWSITSLTVVQPRVEGTVSEVNGDTITVAGRDGATWTITVDAATVFHARDGAGALADVTVGSDISATGDKTGDGALTASSVSVRQPSVAGEVTAVGADSITVKRNDGTTATINVTSDTKFSLQGVTSATLADVKVGDRVFALGTRSDDTTLDATSVTTGHGPGGGGHRRRGPGPDSPASNG